jgi:hypothetical protein
MEKQKVKNKTTGANKRANFFLILSLFGFLKKRERHFLDLEMPFFLRGNS